MAAMRAPRVQVGSTAWILEERNAALQIAQSEVEEFSYSARNELDWLNEHMAGIFNNENETYVNQGIQDSGYFGSQDIAPLNIHMDTDPEDGHISPRSGSRFATVIPLETRPECAVITTDTPEKMSQAAEENQTWRVSAKKPTEPAAETGSDLEYASDDSVDDASPERQLSRKAKKLIDYAEDGRSASDGSSPIRPIVRKSSLNFASLPAREPLTAGKSIGARISRTSHLENIRTSHYNRPTGGKSLGGTLAKLDRGENQEADMDVDDASDAQASKCEDPKTYTQRLQDQINQLGHSQPKHGHLLQQNKTFAPEVSSPPPQLNTLPSTPGAFPEDDDDDWIEPPAIITAANKERPNLPKSHTADVMEGIQGKRTIGEPDFAVSDDESLDESQTEEPNNPAHDKAACTHAKSASVPVIPNVGTAVGEGHDLKRVISASNPSLLTVVETGGLASKSHSRSFRESPLKQVKNKLSSILKSSRGLLASSAAISAEGRLLASPSSTRIGLHTFMSSDSVASLAKIGSQSSAAQPEASPTRPMRRTRASAEREEKKREREAKRLEEQNLKLEKARQKEQEKARVFSEEQERLADMEKQLAAKKDEGRTPEGEPSKPTRSGQRDVKAMEDDTLPVDKDVEMDDAPIVPPPPVTRPLGPAQATRNKELKRPAKPTRETQARPKQAPTVIRVNTGSQHSQYRLSTAQPDASNHTAAQTHQLVSKASKASLQNKPSTQSLRGAAASRAKTQELASKKKEQEEREAQRRREAKAEVERKKAAAQEEQRRQEQHKRQEVDRQRQQQQELAASQSQFKNSAQRKAAIEKAKQTRAPPPAMRSQPNGPPDFSMSQENSAVGRPSRTTSNAPWNLEETNRPVNTVLSTASKAGAKRTLTYDKGDDGQAQHSQSRSGPTYQANDAKRRRTSENFDGEADASSQRNIRGPPVRPSAGFKKEMPVKSVFQNGYANAPPSGAPNLFKATLSSQHGSQMKGAHPLELAQISKGAIPFQPTPNAAGSAYKTPARSGPTAGAKSTAKSGTRSSPRFQNGEAIELPEIQTDDDSEDDESHGVIVAPWADSPDLRKALVRQETMDPSQIFGPPAPLNMEEVFNKSKDRFHKFRARTSSANWSGADRLTEEDIRKDMVARDKLRRDGGWSYEMSKDML
ncbi:hypothetical protein E4U54_005932 [Claviceps lovelessii]|nr:hypothetical protein E4U54_005932 [Claviceps lovelessii]